MTSCCKEIRNSRSPGGGKLPGCSFRSSLLPRHPELRGSLLGGSPSFRQRSLMDPYVELDPYVERLREEVIYLHSLWHQGPPCPRPSYPNPVPVSMPSNRFKKQLHHQGYN
ncbi:hypothetical protein MLD38_021975 [Melastoma candidum]|uniref:Uncharacterized protein n=1 Tax=Melastoma candidum TaxID=119954 RepID=A0ACB9QKQ0_9MYRT|nr:hypothetical protein MLD38_021975 [Melastoma candidum]